MPVMFFEYLKLPSSEI